MPLPRRVPHLLRCRAPSRFSTPSCRPLLDHHEWRIRASTSTTPAKPAPRHSPNCTRNAISSTRRLPRFSASRCYTWPSVPGRHRGADCMAAQRVPRPSMGSLRSRARARALRGRCRVPVARLFHRPAHSTPTMARGSVSAACGLYVAATTALGLILYDRQDLVVGLVAILAVGGVRAGLAAGGLCGARRPEWRTSSFPCCSCRCGYLPSRPLGPVGIDWTVAQRARPRSGHRPARSSL